MKKREKIRLLREAGFLFLRQVNHGEFWTREGQIILVPRQTRNDDRRSCRNWVAQFKRITGSLSPVSG